LRSELAAARQMSADTIGNLQQQLIAAKEETLRLTQPTNTTHGSFSLPHLPMTPMAISQATSETPRPPNYYHIGSAADPGYYESIRNAMSGSDLYIRNMRDSRLTDGRPSSSHHLLYTSTSSTIPLTPSALLRQTRLGRNYPLFKGSTVRVQGKYDLTLIGTNRSRSFRGTPAPYLEGSRFTAVQVHELISHIQSLLRADAYDETCLERLIDDTARGYLGLSFTPLPIMQRYPVSNWMLEWDVAIFIETLEEAFPLDTRDRHLDRGQ